MTTAEQIAEALDGDGLRCTAADGRRLEEMIDAAGGVPLQNWKREATRFDFDDGSAIVVAGNAWDLAHPTCTDVCWEGENCYCDENDDEAVAS